MKKLSQPKIFNQGHGYDPQEGKPPVTFELVKDDIQPGGDVSLKLVADEGVTFKGFIVQVYQFYVEQ